VIIELMGGENHGQCFPASLPVPDKSSVLFVFFIEIVKNPLDYLIGCIELHIAGDNLGGLSVLDSEEKIILDEVKKLPWRKHLGQRIY